VIDAAVGRRPPLTIHGADYPTPDGTCVRDYIHVTDLAAAHLAALTRLEAGDSLGALNLGTGAGHTAIPPSSPPTRGARAHAWAGNRAARSWRRSSRTRRARAAEVQNMPTIPTPRSSRASMGASCQRAAWVAAAFFSKRASGA
jgi:NAD dependent epimerase/dehydratase family